MADSTFVYFPCADIVYTSEFESQFRLINHEPHWDHVNITP
jgi:hypothetical protein